VNIERKLDKFYTNHDVVENFCQKIYKTFPNRELHVIEPSAGAGVFIDPVKRNWDSFEFLDIFGEHQEIQNKNFLESNFLENSLFIGNPPFGKNSSLAVKFFNHAASFKPIGICMIHPKTFMKPRFWKRLDLNYQLSWQEVLPKNSFNFQGLPYDVPCVMQIWVPGNRPPLPEKLELFGSGNHVLIRRAGSKAGKIVFDYTPSSTYSTFCSDEVKESLKHAYPKIKQFASMTAGVRSITLLEIEDVLLHRY
jgi:hypothetical protein